jgi:hypothetical protein
MNARPLVLVAVAAALTAGVVATVRRRDDAPAPAPATPPDAPPDPLPAAPQSETPRRPPEYPDVASDAERIAEWVHMVQTGDDDDVAWATHELRLAGKAGRAALRDAAHAVVEGNDALVEQALEFLIADPDPADAAFARDALRSRDPHAVRRAMRVLAAAPGPDRAGAAKAIADAAIATARIARLDAYPALVRLGGDAAAAQAVRVMRAGPPEELPAACDALAEFRHETLRAFYADLFAGETSPAIRIAAARRLLAGGDTTPVAWLESVAAAAPSGPVDFRGDALGALAEIRHAGALARIGGVVADTLEAEATRLAMVPRLAPYPLPAKREYLEKAAADAPGNDDMLRVEALEALVRAGADDVMKRLETWVRTGDDRAAVAAALVFGKLRRPDAGDALIEAASRKDLGDDARTFCLMAIALSGAADGAETVVRAIALDNVAYDAKFSVARNVAGALRGATPQFRAAAAPALLRALRGELGPLSGAGLVQTIQCAAACCGDEAAAPIGAYLVHADLPVRVAAAGSLGFVAGPGAERDLRAAWWRSADPSWRALVAKSIARAHWRGRR